MSEEHHLFGTPGAEQLYIDLATAYEYWMEDGFPPPDALTVVEFEEWTVVPATGHLPRVDRVLDFVVEWTAENGDLDEYGAEAFEKAATHEDVKVALATALDLLASKVGYRMADEKVATHVITHDAEGRPMLNGELLFPVTA